MAVRTKLLREDLVQNQWAQFSLHKVRDCFNRSWMNFCIGSVFSQWLYLTVPGCRWGLACWTWLPLLPLDLPASSATWAAVLLLWKEPSWTLSGRIQTISMEKENKHVCFLVQPNPQYIYIDYSCYFFFSNFQLSDNQSNIHRLCICASMWLLRTHW